jgi:hypothetical protein
MENKFLKYNHIRNLRKTIFTSIVLLLTIIDTIKTQNLCNLKIAETMMSSFNGNEIVYNFGKIDETRFGKNAITPYTAPLAKEIDYFYVTEIHGVEIKKAHEAIVINKNKNIIYLISFNNLFMLLFACFDKIMNILRCFFIKNIFL